MLHIRDLAKSGGRLALWSQRAPALLYRRLTSGLRATPEVFILGAPKCGTSSLYEYICTSACFIPAYTKELMFLQDLPGFTANHQHAWYTSWLWGRYSQGRASYLKFFPTRRRLALAAERHGGRAVTGEATPFYLYCPTAARRVAELSPHAKLIVLLRNPVDRAFSDYNMQLLTRSHEERSFARAVEDELSERETNFRLRYLEQSRYEPHLRTWLEHFPPAALKVFSAERFFAEPAAVTREALAFLALPPCEQPFYPVANQGRYATQLDAALRRRLEDHFRPFNRRLYELLNMDFGWPA